MALAYQTRKRLSLLILTVGLPLYVIAVWVLLNWIDDTFGRLPLLGEVALYLGLGLVWALPFRTVFRGIGQADPDAGAAPHAERANAEQANAERADPSDPPA